MTQDQSTLLHRLRTEQCDWCTSASCGGCQALFKEAADEIEALRELLDHCCDVPLKLEIAEQRIKRLRAWLAEHGGKQ